MDSLLAKGALTLVPRPANAKVLPCHWEFKINRCPVGTVEGFKARLMAGGNFQVAGEDVGHVFAPVGRLDTLRALLPLTTRLDLHVHTVDISKHS